jgi:hypothetical protein
MSHGSRYHRRPGSMGPVDPASVFKSKKLPGRMGGDQITIQNLEIVKVDPERNLLLIKGNVPGPKKSFLKIKTAVKASNNLIGKEDKGMPKVTLYNQTGHKLVKLNLMILFLVLNQIIT